MKRPNPITTYVLLLFPVLSWFPVFAGGQEVRKVWENPNLNGIAAIVENTVITLDEVRREMSPLISQVRQESRNQQEFDENMSQLYLEILQSLIDRRLIVKAFNDKEEYRLPPTLVESEMDSILIEDFNNDRARFLEHLKARGLTMREYRQDLRDSIVVSIMRGQMQRSISAISPEKIEAFYKENQIQFFEDAAVRLDIILLKPLADESIDLLMQTAEDIMFQLDGGTDFDTLADKYSQYNRSAASISSWISRTDMRPELTDVAFELEVGEYSDPIVVGDSIFILYCEAKKEEGVQPINQVRDEIESTLASQYSREAQQRWLQNLRKDAFIKYY